MPPSTNASYVGRLAPPGNPKTTSTPSAFRHSITASTARISLTSFRQAREKPSVPPGRPTSGGADGDTNRQHGRPAGRHDQQRGAHRDLQEAVAYPGDREQLER